MYALLEHLCCSKVRCYPEIKTNCTDDDSCRNGLGLKSVMDVGTQAESRRIRDRTVRMGMIPGALEQGPEPDGREARMVL